MNKNQEAYKSMAMKTIGEMQKHNKIWKANKVISGTVNDIETLFVEIDKTNARQNVTSKGLTEKKKEYRKQVDNTSDIFLGIFRSYAKTTGNDDLYANSDKSLSEIKKISDTEILVLAGSTKDFASANKEQLKDYGIADDMIKDYGKSIDGYKEYLTKPQENRAEKATATAHLKELFKKLDEQLTEYLDNHMMQFKSKEPQFYSDYENARTIYDAPTIPLSLKGTVLGADDDCDGAEDCPLRYVKVRVKFKAGSELADSVKSTSKKGNYQFKGLQEGICTVTFEKFKYETVTKEIELHKNDLTRLDIKMKKINN